MGWGATIFPMSTEKVHLQGKQNKAGVISVERKKRRKERKKRKKERKEGRKEGRERERKKKKKREHTLKN